MPEAKFNLFKVKLPDWKNQYYLIGYKGKLAQNGARHSEEFAGIAIKRNKKKLADQVSLIYFACPQYPANFQINLSIYSLHPSEQK